ncbi:hypothetical protein DM02DRAFT_644063 [Periconia macrospinosa]|uniref:LisH domain-containing protein n=1 Tax=Periconia macrospinosa TaxID=97972 RepID=A0A2V1DHW0_9PLEO|nr:hypothetical protein DM02DRAFT_644063 [Periconia macrospinosa]
MANMNAGGPVTGTPIMNNGQRRPQGQMMEPRDQLNTYIYDYFIRNNHPQVARMMIKCDLKMKLGDRNQKTSPSGRNVNGVGDMDSDSIDDLPPAEVPAGQVTENSFLLDWWVQFWDIYSAARGSGNKGTQYTGHVRNLTHMTNEQRNQRMMMTGGMNGMNGMNPAQYGMVRMPNGMPKPNDLQRAAMNNRNPGQAAAMANMNQLQKQAMMGTQMQRDGSQMDMNGRPQSPGSNDNAASPNKRQRVEGGMNAANGPNQFNDFAGQQNKIEVYAQSLAQQQRMALNNHAITQGMNAGVQGSPMTQPGVLDGSGEIFAGNQPRTGMPAGQPGQQPGNHALQDYQMQLMLLEQQNKKRLLMARQEQDNMSGSHQGVAGPAGFSAAMSPQGSRAGGPSPNPTDQMKKNTPRMGAQGLPGSPMPEGMMQPQRNSPAPNMPYDPNGPPQGFPQQYPGLPGQMPTTMRPNPSSHPGQFNGQQLTPQQMEAMQRSGAMPNGAWRGPQGQPGMMMPNQQPMGPMGGQPQVRGQMPPPPAPANEQARPQVPSPSQPPAPPTPSQTNKANPKKKNTKDNKKPANKKGATGATPAASGAEEPPTPTTPMHKPFGPNGQQAPQAPTQPQPPAAPQQQQQPQQPQQQQQQQQPIDNNAGPPFGSISQVDDGFPTELGLGFDDGNALDTFDFESFLHVGDDSTGLGFGSGDFNFEVEAGGDLA